MGDSSIYPKAPMKTSELIPKQTPVNKLGVGHVSFGLFDRSSPDPTEN